MQNAAYKTTQEITPLDTGQAQILLEAARDDRFECLYVLSLMRGLRMGDALGLKWSDIDLELEPFGYTVSFSG